MNQFVEQFRNLSTEALLEKRALGPDGLASEAHAAVEQLLSERGVPIPPMPAQLIAVDSSIAEPRRSAIGRNAVLVTASLIAVAVAKQFAVTWAGLLFTAAVGMYVIIEWSRRQSLSASERLAEDEVRKAEYDGLTELMQCAASGNLARAKELLAYGANINTKSSIGSTALMYAAKNGHLDVAEFLLQSGADPSIRTLKGNSAVDLARNAGHEHVVELIMRSDAR